MRRRPCSTQQAHGNAGKAAKATPGRGGTMTEPLDQLFTPAASSLFPMHLSAGTSVRMRQGEGEGRDRGRMAGGLADLSEEFRVVLKADGETGRRLCPTAHGQPRAHLPGSTLFAAWLHTFSHVGQRVPSWAAEAGLGHRTSRGLECPCAHSASANASRGSQWLAARGGRGAVSCPGAQPVSRTAAPGPSDACWDHFPNKAPFESV